MTRFQIPWLPVAVLALLSFSGPRAALAQASGAAKAGSAIPRTPDGKPDLSGVWQRPYVPDMTRNAKDQVGAGPLPYTPAGEAIFKAYDPAKFDYTGRCLPQGLTRSMNSPFPLEIFQNPGKIAFLYEPGTYFTWFRSARSIPKIPTTRGWETP
jgi:hypothetical protein